MKPSEDSKILDSNQYHKSDKAPFIIYADFKSLTEKTDECEINSEKASTTIALSFSMSRTSSFKSNKNKNDVYTG